MNKDIIDKRFNLIKSLFDEIISYEKVNGYFIIRTEKYITNTETRNLSDFNKYLKSILDSRKQNDDNIKYMGYITKGTNTAVDLFTWDLVKVIKYYLDIVLVDYSYKLTKSRNKSLQLTIKNSSNKTVYLCKTISEPTVEDWSCNLNRAFAFLKLNTTIKITVK